MIALHLLRFVENENRAVAANDIDGLSGLKVVEWQINPPVVLTRSVERLDVDDHHIDSCVRGEGLKVVQLLRVVCEESRLLSVGVGEVVGGDLEGFENAFANRDARHHYYEFRPSIQSVQFKDRLDVAICLSGTGLHLDVEIDVAALARHKFLRNGESLSLLHFLDVFQQLFLAQSEFRVAESDQFDVLGREQRTLARFQQSWVDPIPVSTRYGLSDEAVHNRLDRIGLIFLNLEFEFHRIDL